MFGFNEAGKPKTSLAKYSVEFNDFAVQMKPMPYSCLNPLLLYVILK